MEQNWVEEEKVCKTYSQHCGANGVHLCRRGNSFKSYVNVVKCKHTVLLSTFPRSTSVDMQGQCLLSIAIKHLFQRQRSSASKAGANPRAPSRAPRWWWLTIAAKGTREPRAYKFKFNMANWANSICKLLETRCKPGTERFLHVRLWTANM